jgi:peptide/nickel transport system permease protein
VWRDVVTATTHQRARGDGGNARRLLALRAWRPPLLIALAILVLLGLIVLAVLAPVIAPHDIRTQNLLARLQPPYLLGGSELHPLGTDQLGRDVASRLLFALRTTLGIAAIGTLIGMALGVTLGLLAGMLRGWVESVVMFLVDVQLSLPFVLVALTVIALTEASMTVLVLVVGIAGWEIYARVVRGQVLVVRGLPFVEAASALGASSWRTMWLHVFPNVTSPIIVLATVNFSYVVLLESALSFLGLGVQPPNTSLGAMLGMGRDYMISLWTLAAIPGAVIVTITMVVSLIGDWFRDVLDPRFRS